MTNGEYSHMNIETIDHVGIRVADLDRAMAFYELFGFKVIHKAGNDPVAVVKNDDGVELNLVFNATDTNSGDNILMDISTKYPGFTHIAFRVDSVLETVNILNDNDIVITQGPVKFMSPSLYVTPIETLWNFAAARKTCLQSAALKPTKIKTDSNLKVCEDTNHATDRPKR
jgi:lactoylglutathione lyase